MAYTYSRTVIPLGDQTGRKQSVVEIPAQALADKPGVLSLVSVNDSAVRTPYYLWVDSTGQLRIHTSIPTNQDSDGSTVTSGASTTLNNLGTTAINAALIPGTAAIDLGTDAAPFRTEHLLTSLILNQTTGNYTITWDDPAAGRAISIPDPGATATIMLDAGAANVIAYTKGTSTIAMAANADLDIATGVTVNIDTALTVNTESVTLNQSLSTTDAVAFATGSTIGNLTLANGTITDSGGAISFGNENLTTTGTINVGADNVDITLGASGATDSRIFFDGSGNLMFFDSNQGAARSLTDIYTGTTLNPTVIGNLSVSDGNFTWTNTATNETAVFTLAATTVDGIQIASSNTEADALQITATGTTSGNLLSLNAVDATMTAGAYIYCYDGAAQDFAVRRYGATTIAGSAAGTAALTMTTGDVALSSGRLTQTTTADVSNTFARNNATGTAAVVTIQEVHATGGTTLLVNSDATDGNDALQVTHDGTGYGLSVIGTAVTGKQALFQGPASQTASSVFIDGTTGSWIGAANVGMLQLSSDGALADVAASLLKVNYTGNAGGAAVIGAVADFNYSGVASGNAYAVRVQSSANHGIYLDTSAATKTQLRIIGPSAQSASMVIMEGGATNGWGGAATTGMLHLSLDGNTLATTASAIQVVIGTGTPTDASLGYVLRIADTTTAPATPAGTYAVHASTTSCGAYFTTTNVASTAMTLAGPTVQTAPILKIDGTTTDGWVGAATTGMVHITGDGAVAADGSLLRVASSGQPAAANDGVCLEILESGAAQATSYAVRIASTNNEALHVDTGLSLFDEKATFSGGLCTQCAVNDIHDTVPTNANIEAAFGTAAAAGAGFIGIINDANGDANVWIMYSDGTSWFYLAKGTKAV